MRKIAEVTSEIFGFEDISSTILSGFGGEFISATETELNGVGEVTVEKIKITLRLLLNRVVLSDYIILPDGTDPYKLSDEIAATGLTDKDFAEPKFYIDITQFLKTILFLSMFSL